MAKIAFKWLLLMLSLWVLILVMLSLPPIQTRLTSLLSSRLSKASGFDVKIGYLNVRWFDQTIIQDVSIKDSLGTEMISARKALIDWKLWQLWRPDKISLDKVRLENGRLAILRRDGDADFNISVFAANLNSQKDPESKDPEKAPIAFEIDHIVLVDVRVSLDDFTKAALPQGQWDYNHFDFRDINSRVSDFRVISDTISAKINFLRTLEFNQNFPVNNLKTHFLLNASQMEFEDLDMATEKSQIQGDLAFHYDQILDLSDFNQKVTIEARIEKSKVHTQELNMVAPGLDNFNDLFSYKGEINGTVERLRLNEFLLGFGHSSVLRGSVAFNGLPVLEETFYDLNLLNSFIHPEDLIQYLPREKFAALYSLGTLSFSGSFLGFYNDFVSQGNLYTGLGSLEMDLNLKLGEEKELPKYRGNLITRRFEFGKFLENEELFQQIDMEGQIEGEGLNIQQATLQVNATFQNLGLLGYDYQNLKVDGKLNRQFFEGSLALNDPKGKIEANANVDLRPESEKMFITAKIRDFDLLATGLMEDSARFSSNISMDLKGLHPDRMVGYADFDSLDLHYRGRKAFLDSLNFISSKFDGQRKFFFQTKGVKLQAGGNFNYTHIFEDMGQVFGYYKAKLTKDEDSIGPKNISKRKSAAEIYNFWLEGNFSNPDPILNLLYPGIHLAPNTLVKLEIENENSHVISGEVKSNEIGFGGLRFHQNRLDFHSSIHREDEDILSIFNFTSKNQDIAGNASMEDFYTEVLWKGKNVELDLSFKNEESGDRLALFSEINLYPDSVSAIFDFREAIAFNKNWEINPDNLVFWTPDGIGFEKFDLKTDNQTISLIGGIGPRLEDELFINLDNFQAKNMNPFVGNDLDGSLSGQITLKALQGKTAMVADLKLAEFKIDEIAIGDFSLNSTWDAEGEKMSINSFLERENEKVLSLEGAYFLQKPEPLDLSVQLTQTRLDLLQPFLSETFSEMEGFINADIIIKGKLNDPDIQGSGRVEQGQLRINYLNTLYAVDGQISFEEKVLSLKDWRLMDSDQNQGRVNGKILFNGLSDIRFDVKGEATRMKILNKPTNLEDFYYGTAYATGNFQVQGDMDNIKIDARLTSNKGTRIYIPLSRTAGVSQEDYIDFADLSQPDAVKLLEEAEKVDLSGIQLDLDFDITPDAYTEIIFDIRTGDIIRGRGNGTLSLQINSNGDFNMFGDLEIQEGAYNFTLYNIINKEFSINPGSTLRWYGDPYEGILDIKATYQQLASIAPLIPPTESLGTEGAIPQELRVKYPALVYLELKGPLMSPEISFDVELKDYPDNIMMPDGNILSMEAIVGGFKARLEADEQELKRQVFSLIILRRFSPENAFNMGGSAIGSSVSELISNQLSYWINQFDENLEIDLDLAGMDQEAFNAFQLRLSYSFMDGRLRVTRDGAFSNMENQNEIGTLAGDWTVEYLLTEDGKLRVKMYNRTNFNPFAAGLESNTVTTAGVSLQYTRSFNVLKELIRDAREEEEEKEKSDESEEKKEKPQVEARKEEEVEY